MKIKILAVIMVFICVAFAACAKSEAPSSSVAEASVAESVPLSVEASEESVSVSSQSEASQEEPENTFTAVFAVGANLQDEKTMRVGDTIGDWTLADLKIQYNGEDINRLNALFEGNVTLNGTISRNVFVEYGFDFEVSKEDMAKMPYYISPEMTYDDRFGFMLDFADDSDGAIKLYHGEEIDCTITISDYRFIFAYMMAPDSATVVDIKFN